MEQNILNKNIWSAAGTAGLALGAVSAAYLFAGQWISGDLAPAALWQSVIAIVLWTVKFAGCIWLMYHFMRKFAEENVGAHSKAVFRMGMATALLSALMYSGIYLANMLYISADYYNMVIQTTLQQMRPAMDANSLAALDMVMDALPQITFFYNLIYCFLFGTVLSAIISRKIK